MSLQRLSQQVLWAVLITLLLAGCGAPAATPTPVPPTPAIVVTFDGKECTVSGPAELPTGEYLIAYKNRSGQALPLYVERLRDGHTFQDLLDLQSEPGALFPEPEFITTVRKKEYEQVAEGEMVYTYSFDKEAEHYIVLWRGEQLWLCAPFQVTEAPSG